ncbi:CRISPR-associated protein Cas4 [Candidatus Micrarchaeota archaeon]|nr:CRISPR-associated protein Cas4 [Candidatus Micrarchaeota archaeon]MBU1887485.1 CRISPR-associated protein Cas4 [Candidatus Micrarchaeota archaeon]
MEKITRDTLEKILLNRTHLVESYFFCKRQFFLNLFGIYNHNHNLLEIGRVMHKKRDNTEQEPVKVDQIDWEGGKIIEFKKHDISFSSEIQAYYYLKRLNSYGSTIKKAVVRSIEKRKSKIVNYPDQAYEQYISEMVNYICSYEKIPSRKEKRGLCSNCSLFEYCWVE